MSSSPGYIAGNLLATASLTYRDASDVAQIPSTASQFQIGYAGDSRAGRIFKYRSPELANIRMAWVANVTANLVAVVNHNWAADSVHRLEWSPDGTNWNLAIQFTPDRTRYYVTFASQAALFWRVRTTSWGSQVATPYVGEIWLGLQITLPRGLALGPRKGPTGNTEGTKTAFGQEERNFKSSFESVEGVYAPGLTDAELAQVLALPAAVGYGAGRFLFIPDVSVPTCWIARLSVDSFRPVQHLDSQWNDFPFTVHEEPFGAPVA